MSLINDALKRAKEAHESLPPPPPTAAVPQFRPAEPAQRPHFGSGVLVLAALCVLLLLALLISWVWVQKGAKSASTEIQTPAPPVASTAPTTPTVAPSTVAVPAPIPQAQTQNP